MANGFVNDDLYVDGGIDCTTGVTFDSGSTYLNAYLEGTFTPVFSGAGTAGVGTYTAQFGFYTVVGNRCFIDYYCRISAHTGTGTLQGYIPFAAITSAGYNGTGAYQAQVVNHTGGAITATTKFVSAAQYFRIVELIDNSAEASINIQNVNNFQFFTSAAYLLP